MQNAYNERHVYIFIKLTNQSQFLFFRNFIALFPLISLVYET